MSHVTEGSLQEYLDGEVDAAAAAAVRDHVARCESCARELTALRGAARHAHEALALLDSPAPVLRARAGVAARRRPARRLAGLGSRSLARAAMLLLVLAGAGAAAIPDVRRAVESTFARVAELLRGGSEQAAAPEGVPVPDAETPAVARNVASVAPADGRVRVVLHPQAAPLDVVVRLSDGSRAQVETEGPDSPVWRSGSGRLEVLGVTSGTVTVQLPRSAVAASVEVDGQVVVYKEGALLRLTGPAGAGGGSEVRFRTTP